MVVPFTLIVGLTLVPTSAFADGDPALSTPSPETTTGATGPTEPSPAPEPTGPVTSPGPSAPTGATGASGPSGAPEASGPSGATEASGPSGATGTTGPTTPPPTTCDFSSLSPGEITAAITSEFPDYRPGATVNLSGSGFSPGETVCLRITEDNPSETWTLRDSVLADADGNVTYTLQISPDFIAQYRVRAWGLSSGAYAESTFTDAPKLTAKDHEGQRSTGAYTSGNITTYKEGDRINFRFTLDGDANTSGDLYVRFTGNDSTCLFFDGTFNLGTHDNSAPALVSISGATPTVTLVGSPQPSQFGTSNGEWLQQIHVVFNSAGVARVNYYLRLSSDAGECSGSSQHSRLDPISGDVSQSGAQNVPVPANQIIELPDITVTKQLDTNGDGTIDRTANAGEFCFKLNNGTCQATNASGQVVFTDVTTSSTATNFTITEQQLIFTAGTFTFDSGTGTNCTFNGSTATATALAGTTAQHASCVFKNKLGTGTLTVIKQVVNDEAGNKASGDFTIHVKDANQNEVGTSPDPGSTTGTQYPVSPGTYTVSEEAVAGYTGTFSGDCNQSGVVTVGAGQNKTCTITNTDNDVASAITVTKDAFPSSLPEPGGDFTFSVEVANDSTADTVTISSLTDDIYGSLDGQGDCDVSPAVSLAPGDSYECSFTGSFTGGPGAVQTDVVTASGTDDDGATVSDTDDAVVEITDVESAGITVTKDADPTSMDEPGGTFTFSVSVLNDSAVDTVTLDTLSDDIYGDLDGKGDCVVGSGIVLEPGADYSCSFTGQFLGNAGAVQTDVVTASGTDDDGATVSDTDDAVVEITDALPTLTVSKTANPTTVLFTGGMVTFTISVENTSAEPVMITDVVDDVDNDGTNDVTFDAATICGDRTLDPGQTTTCTFKRNMSGQPGREITDKATVAVIDDEGNEASGDDTATVTLGWRGRTPGYWKNHTREWPKFSVNGVSVTTSTKVSQIFTSTPSSCTKQRNATLLQGLAFQGGTTLCAKAEILLRAAVASMLNEALFGAQFPPYSSVNALVADVNATLATGNAAKYVALAATLDGWNNGIH
jgi:hypothetical protein